MSVLKCEINFHLPLPESRSSPMAVHDNVTVPFACDVAMTARSLIAPGDTVSFAFLPDSCGTGPKGLVVLGNLNSNAPAVAARVTLPFRGLLTVFTGGGGTGYKNEKGFFYYDRYINAHV